MTLESQLLRHQFHPLDRRFLRSRIHSKEALAQSWVIYLFETCKTSFSLKLGKTGKYKERKILRERERLRMEKVTTDCTCSTWKTLALIFKMLPDNGVPLGVPKDVTRKVISSKKKNLKKLNYLFPVSKDVNRSTLTQPSHSCHQLFKWRIVLRHQVVNNRSPTSNTRDIHLEETRVQ